jgi:hypothetical protein
MTAKRARQVEIETVVARSAAIQRNQYLSALEQTAGKPLRLPRPT